MISQSTASINSRLIDWIGGPSPHRAVHRRRRGRWVCRDPGWKCLLLIRFAPSSANYRQILAADSIGFISDWLSRPINRRLRRLPATIHTLNRIVSTESQLFVEQRLVVKVLILKSKTLDHI